MKRYIALPFLATLLVACTKEIAIDYPESKTLLTLNCIFDPDHPILASLSTTLPFTTLASSPQYKDGVITLFENGKLIDTLRVCERAYREKQGDTTFLYCSSKKVVQGNVYQLRAFRPGYSEVSGLAVVPSKGKVTKIQSTPAETYEQPYEITIEDDGSRQNFYILQVISDNGLLGRSYASLSTDDPTINLYSNYGMLEVPTDARLGTNAYFTDEYFNGKQKTLKLDVAFVQEAEANGVLLYSVSKEYYEFAKALELNNEAAQNIFTEPLRLKSNVVNGFGLVGATNITWVRF